MEGINGSAFMGRIEYFYEDIPPGAKPQAVIAAVMHGPKEVTPPFHYCSYIEAIEKNSWLGRKSTHYQLRLGNILTPQTRQSFEDMQAYAHRTMITTFLSGITKLDTKDYEAIQVQYIPVTGKPKFWIDYYLPGKQADPEQPHPAALITYAPERGGDQVRVTAEPIMTPEGRRYTSHVWNWIGTLKQHDSWTAAYGHAIRSAYDVAGVTDLMNTMEALGRTYEQLPASVKANIASDLERIRNS